VLADNEIEILPFDEAQVRMAADAFDRYGKGLGSKAQLDCRLERHGRENGGIDVDQAEARVTTQASSGRLSTGARCFQGSPDRDREVVAIINRPAARCSGPGRS
jgi:hypothetical protein